MWISATANDSKCYECISATHWRLFKLILAVYIKWLFIVCRQQISDATKDRVYHRRGTWRKLPKNWNFQNIFAITHFALLKSFIFFYDEWGTLLNIFFCSCMIKKDALRMQRNGERERERVRYNEIHSKYDTIDSRPFIFWQWRSFQKIVRFYLFNIRGEYKKVNNGYIHT